MSVEPNKQDDVVNTVTSESTGDSIVEHTYYESGRVDAAIGVEPESVEANTGAVN